MRGVEREDHSYGSPVSDGGARRRCRIRARPSATDGARNQRCGGERWECDEVPPIPVLQGTRLPSGHPLRRREQRRAHRAWRLRDVHGGNLRRRTQVRRAVCFHGRCAVARLTAAAVESGFISGFDRHVGRLRLGCRIGHRTRRRRVDSPVDNSALNPRARATGQRVDDWVKSRAPQTPDGEWGDQRAGHAKGE